MHLSAASPPSDLAGPTPTADDVSILVGGAAHAGATLVLLPQLPAAAAAAPEATAPNATAYRLVLHLDPPAAGGEAVRVDVASRTLPKAPSPKTCRSSR